MADSDQFQTAATVKPFATPSWQAPIAPRTSSTPKVSRIPGLDGVRAIAFLIVLFSHAGLGRFVPGGLGVTIFFVLSGFLITTLMRVEVQRTGRLSFRNFYLRRALRILPPLYLTLVVAIGIHMWSGTTDPVTFGGLAAVVSFVGNYWMALTHFLGIPKGVGVTWSLAIEEHFYLLYPPIATYFLLRGSRARAVHALATFCAAVLAWRLFLILVLHVEGQYVYMSTDGRADALAFGCLLALGCNPVLDPVPPPKAGRELLLLLGSLALLVASMVYRAEWFRDTLRYSVQCIALLPLFWLLVARARWWPFRWLNGRVISHVGVLSYVLYLIHQPVTDGLQTVMPGISTVPLLLVTLAVSLLWAQALWQGVERPLARVRRRLERGRREAPRPSPMALQRHISF